VTHLIKESTDLKVESAARDVVNSLKYKGAYVQQMDRTDLHLMME
jgi:hypothetical protein